MGTVAHTSLKLLRMSGANVRKFNALVPGAGLEPARTLPGPRDFKSVTYRLQRELTHVKALYQRLCNSGAAPLFVLLPGTSATDKLHRGHTAIRDLDTEVCGSIDPIDSPRHSLTAVQYMSYSRISNPVGCCKPARPWNFFVTVAQL
jgi:hypothetical protein